MAWDSTPFVKSWLNSNHSWLWIGQLGRNQWKHPVRINWLYRIYNRSMFILFLVNCVTVILPVSVCVCVCVCVRALMCSVAQLCLTHGLPCSSVLEIFQARMLEWVAISSSRGSSQPRDQTHVSYVSGIGGQILYHVGIIYNKLMFILTFLESQVLSFINIVLPK